MSAFIFIALIVLAWVIKQFVTSSSSGGGSSPVDKDLYRSNKPYPRNYSSDRKVVALPSPAAAKGSSQGLAQCKFFLSAKHHLQRDYILVIDRSGSMSGNRWKEAEAAVKTLAPYICKFDPDGVTLLLFDHEVQRFDGIKSEEEVKGIFSSYRPRGSTNLSLALHTAFLDHFGGKLGATTVLVVTDGAPDSQPEVERIIRRAANSLEKDEELSVSFIQIGTDRGATKFLQYLDDDLPDVKYDIVDTIPATQANGMSFPELIARSIYD